jgi:5'-deoxynucleotidase YfbR-like HD superfamily hydrolase
MLKPPDQLSRDNVMTSRALAARVRRYHTWPVLHVQTVAEHSARVATLYVEIFGLPRAEVLYYILHHDSGEFTAGDPPFPVKKNFPDLKKGHDCAEAWGLSRLGVLLPDLAVWEKHRVKVADLLEMHEFGVVELTMGNQYADPIVRDTLFAALKVAHETLEPDAAQAVRRWTQTNGVELS